MPPHTHTHTHGNHSEHPQLVHIRASHAAEPQDLASLSPAFLSRDAGGGGSNHITSLSQQEAEEVRGGLLGKSDPTQEVVNQDAGIWPLGASESLTKKIIQSSVVTRKQEKP